LATLCIECLPIALHLVCTISSTEKTLFVAFVFAVRFNAETDNQPATDGHEKAQIHTTKNLESVCSASYYTISCIFLGFFPFFGY
jgi:hypothetical protein